MSITRRRFLQGVTAAGATVGVASLGLPLPACAPPDRVIQPATPHPARPILVVVFLDGGNDWLNVMPPTVGKDRGVYEARRPSLAVKAADLVEIGAGFGLNSELTGMSLLSDLGRVAWLPGVGMNNPNLSHFVSRDLWGQGSAQPDGTGWLGRYADSAFDPSADALRGVAVTDDLPVMLRGQGRSFVSIDGPTGYVYPGALQGGGLRSPWDAALLAAGYEAAVTAPTAGAPPGQAVAARVGKSFLDATRSFGVDGALPPRTPAVKYPGDAGYPLRRLDGGNLSGYLAYQLKLVAQMIAAGLETQVFFTRIGGWDTHANQAVDHPNLMRALGGSLSAFYDDLETIGVGEENAQRRTMVLVWSEFGRRVQQNQNGTDHGAAGLAFCMGRGVTGGFYGRYPDLTDLDGNGNMRFTVDFRSLYATVLERWMGLDGPTTDALILQGAAVTPYPRLDFLPALAPPP
jgi:uncharacterized protein (DUF1501 family)